MTSSNAKATLSQLYHNSQYFRGLLHGREAWGGLSLPTKKHDPIARANLIKLFRDIAEALETEDGD